MPKRGQRKPERPRWHHICQQLSTLYTQKELVKIFNRSRRSIREALASDETYANHKSNSRSYIMRHYVRKRNEQTSTLCQPSPRNSTPESERAGICDVPPSGDEPRS